MMLLNSVPNTVASCKVNRKKGILILMFHVKLYCTQELYIIKKDGQSWNFMGTVRESREGL